MGLIVSIYDGETGTGRENRLHYWLRFDAWNFNDAMFILCDLDPDLTEAERGPGDELAKAGDFAGRTYDPWKTEIDDAARRVRDLRRIWWSGDHDESVQSPAEWIAWARRKRIRIPWLDWAERNGLLAKIAEPSSTSVPASANASGADPDHPNWPEELGIAWTAWRAAINRKDTGQRPAAFIRDWLRTNHPELSDAARDRIATVANWDKSPGMGKSDGGAR